MLTGCLTALATPFTDDGIDERAFADHVSWQVEEGAGALVPCTATGEAPTLTPAERGRLIAVAVEVSAGRVPVVAGIVTSCTAGAAAQARAAERAGVQAVLLAMPAYNRPTQEGLYRHVETVAAATSLPLILQDDPSRTGVRLTPATAGRLAGLDAVIGIAGGPPGVAVPPRGEDGAVALLATDDSQALPSRIAGGAGTLSVAANVAPRLCAALHDAFRAGDWSRAAAIQHRLGPLVRALDLETDPAPVKYALFLVRTHFSPALRLPLVPVSCRTARMVAAALEGLGADIAFH